MRYITCMSVQANKQWKPRSQPCCDLEGMPEARFFKALCDPTRLRILASLIAAGEPRTVGEIAEPFPVDVSVVSRHLAVLRDQGILTARKHGKEVRYAVNSEFLVKMLQEFAAMVEQCCPPDKE